MAGVSSGGPHWSRAEVVTEEELRGGEQGWTVCVVCTHHCKDFAFTLRDEKSVEGFEQTSLGLLWGW